MRIGLSALIVLVLIAATAFAADMYSVNSGATVQIDEHGVCQRITNSHSSGQAIMVPTRTATEWTTFRNNRPAGVAMVACPTGGTWQNYQTYCGGGQPYPACPGSPYPQDALGQPCSTSGELCTAYMSQPGACQDYFRIIAVFICQ